MLCINIICYAKINKFRVFMLKYANNNAISSILK